MKQTRKLVGYLVAGAIALAMISTSTAQVPKERTAKVVRVKGAARYSTGNNIWQPLEAGTVLKAGAILQTAADSFVDVVLGESGSEAATTAAMGGVAGASGLSYKAAALQDVVRVFADSVLAIDRLTTTDTGIDQVTETQLDLRSGKIFGTVKKMSAGSRYEIKIPKGVAGIRGTSYTITADGVVTVYDGSVVVAYTGPDGNPVTQVVMAGQEFNLNTGQLGTAGSPPEGPQPSEVFTGETVVTIDHTVYFVSPTQEGQSAQPGLVPQSGGAVFGGLQPLHRP